MLTNPDLRELRRSHLLSAASWQGAWANQSHKAFAYLILGNDYLFEAMQSSDLQMGELDCALESFEQGMSFLSGHESPETRAALLNNKGYLLALKGVLLSQNKELKRAKAHFKAASRLKIYPDALASEQVSASIASKNLKRLKKIRKLLAGKVSSQLKGSKNSRRPGSGSQNKQKTNF